MENIEKIVNDVNIKLKTSYSKKITIQIQNDYISVNYIKIFTPKNGQLELINEFLNKSGEECYKNTAIGQIINVIESHNEEKGLEIFCHPDVHSGYYFPIGTVLVQKLKENITSPVLVFPEGVGYDIGCGVRTISTNISKDEILKYDLLKFGESFQRLLYDNIKITQKELANILNGGIDNSLKFNCDNIKKPLNFIEGYNKYVKDAVQIFDSVDQTIQKSIYKLFPQIIFGKGLQQFGTLGKGNHYLEFQYIDEIFDLETASKYNLSLNQILISIHSGSRSLGHKVCDYFTTKLQSPCMNINSEEGQLYYKMVIGGNNYAFCNREAISLKVFKALSELLNKPSEGGGSDLAFKILTDTSHNTVEIIKEDSNEYLLHRKGASAFKNTDPDSLISIGGSMATSSYLVKPGPKAKDFYYTTCHGSGRKLSRSEARNSISVTDVEQGLIKNKIIVLSKNVHSLVEEAGECYKPIDSVIEHSEKIGSCIKVIKMKPLLVFKE